MVKYLLKKSYQRKNFKEIEFDDLWNKDGVFTTMWIYNKPPKILFFKTHIDKSFEHENSNYRKPRTGMLTEYIKDPEIDLKSSFVIGDRESDMQLAKNLNCSGILYNGSELDDSLDDVVKLKTNSWKSVYEY